MASHAKLSASGSHRWINCPGSVAAESQFPNGSSTFAQEGTAAHALAELCLTSQSSPDAYIGQVIEGVEIDAEMAEHVQGYVSFVNSFDGEHFYEQRVDFSQWVPDGFGTSDAIVIGADKVHVIDLKYGRGVVVDAEDNTQGMLYALGVYNDYGYLLDKQDVFAIHIYQPRAGNFSEWEISLKDLLRFGEVVKLAAEEALKDDAERVAGDKQCQFCAAKATCPALMKYAQDVIIAEFDDLEDLQEPGKLSNAQIRSVLAGKKLVESWLGAVENRVFEILANGGKFKGYKLVEGRSVRQWADESQAEQKLLELREEKDIFTRKLISPAQAEKVLGKKQKGEIESLIVKPTGKPTMVPDSDPRPALDDVSDCFENLT